MSRVKQLIAEVHRRSLWQVLAIYVAASWVVLEAADVLVDRLALPDWVYGAAIVLLLVGLPIVLATAFIQQGFAQRSARDPTLLPTEDRAAARAPATGLRGLFTWRNAIGGGVLAFALWGVVAAVLLLLGRGSGSGSAESAVRDVDPSVVAVLPFRTSGAEQSLSYLREGMMDLLAAKLTGEGGPRAADPRSVMSAWNRASESDQEELPRDAALDVARSVGAGRVLLGGIVGTPGHLVINASLLELGDGRAGAQATVEGPADSLTALVDRLAAQLLAREAGEAEHRLSSLTSTSLPALRAYLDGQAAYRRGAHAEAAEHFRRAIEVDSSFALAAIGRAYATYWSENQFDPEALGRAWRHRDRLSERDRAVLLSVTGLDYPEPPSGREALRLAERAVEMNPERPESWYWLGEIYYHGGAAMGFDDPWERAEAAFARAVQLDSAFASALFHLTDLAALQEDTAELRRRAQLYTSVGSGGEILDWLTARVLGDSVELAAVRARYPQMSQTGLRAIARNSQLRGMELEDAELAVAVLGERLGTRAERWEALMVEHDLRLNQGRPQAALEVTRRMEEVAPAPDAPLALRVLDGLYAGGDPVAAARAAETLEARVNVSGPNEPVGPVRFGGVCFPALWRVAHGDTSGAAQVISNLRKIRADLQPQAVWPNRLCTALIEAMLAGSSGRDGDPAVERLDSLALSDPVVPPPLLSAVNLTVSRLFENRGELERALAAVRRRHFYAPTYLAAHLREEGRLAALTGDREGAIRAYRHYLTLRSEPEPALAAEVERVRAELASLVGEGARR